MSTYCVVGTGKLGLCWALILNKYIKDANVIGIDTNDQYIQCLRHKNIETIEPQVIELLRNSNIDFTTNFEYMLNADIIFVVVNTPSLPTGGYDHSNIENIVDILKKFGKRDKPISLVINCTTMPQYCQTVQDRLKKLNYIVYYNPEFIAQGNIINGLVEPDMVLIGRDLKINNEQSLDHITNIYKNIMPHPIPIHVMSLTEAEITKIALNCFITTKISFANMVGDIAIKANCNPDNILNAIGSDTRVGKKYLNYGYGFGGPCVKPHTKIQTKRGLIPICDITVKDEVLTHLGRYRKVSKIFKRLYQGDITKIYSMGFNQMPIETTPDHPIWGAFRNYSNSKFRKANGTMRLNTFKGFKKYQFIEAKHLNTGDCILIPKLDIDIIETPILNIGKHKRSNISEHLTLNKDLMRLFGFYISEGSSWKKEIKISLHKKETIYAQDIINIVRNELNSTAKIKTRKNTNGISVHFTATHLVPILKNLFGTCSKNKCAPISWLGLKDELLIELLRGIWYGDGSRSGNVFTLGITSYCLCRFVQLALTRFGIPSNISINKAHVGKDNVSHQQSYFLCVGNGRFYKIMNKLLPALKITNIPKGSDLTRYKNNQIGYNIKNVEIEYYEGDVYNLEIEEDNSYMLEWGVVHNCFPRDNRALAYFAKKKKISPEISYATEVYNKFHLNYQLEEYKKKIPLPNKINLTGVAYKKNVDILEESQQLKLAIMLAEAGYTVMIHDIPQVIQQLKKLYGNKFGYEVLNND